MCGTNSPLCCRPNHAAERQSLMGYATQAADPTWLLPVQFIS
jgi:hypothetical protein